MYFLPISTSRLFDTDLDEEERGDSFLSPLAAVAAGRVDGAGRFTAKTCLVPL